MEFIPKDAEMPGDPPIEGLGEYLMNGVARTSGSCTWLFPRDTNYKEPPRRFHCGLCTKEYKTTRQLAWVGDDYDGQYICKKCWKAVGSKWK